MAGKIISDYKLLKVIRDQYQDQYEESSHTNNGVIEISYTKIAKNLKKKVSPHDIRRKLKRISGNSKLFYTTSSFTMEKNKDYSDVGYIKWECLNSKIDQLKRLEDKKKNAVIGLLITAIAALASIIALFK